MSGAERLSPMVLVGPGVVAVVVGLFVWLGGLGYRKVLAAITGAIFGAILTSAVIGWAALPTAVSAVVAAAVAMTFEKVFITAFAGALAAAIGLAFFMGPQIETTLAAEPGGLPEGSAQVKTLDIGHSVEKLRAWAIDVGAATRSACSQMPLHKWAITALGGLAIVAGGSFLWRPTAALYFSAAGTMLVFAGMVLLLLYKGVMPVSRICRRPSVYSGVFAAMVVFGTAEQLLLCRSAKAQSAKKETGRGRNKIERK